MHELHPHSLTITLLVISQAQEYRHQHRFAEHPAYEVIERAASLAGYTDDAKADLYARMAESVDHTQPLMVIQRAVSDCLIENRKVCPHG